MQGWTTDHQRLMGLLSAPPPPGFPVPLPPVPPTLPYDAFAPAVAAGDSLLHELAAHRHDRSKGAVAERQQAEYRVRALEVQLARENHARGQGLASFSTADRGVSAFSREPSARAGESVPLGDRLNQELGQSSKEAMKARIHELTGRVQELEGQLSGKRGKGR